MRLLPHLILPLLFLHLAFPTLQASTEMGKFLEWEQLPSLPDSKGLAGSYAGISGDALILAGGANFPDPVWEEEKAWHDQVYALLKTESPGPGHRWISAGKLARPVAYGAAVTHGGRLICIGGTDGERVYRDVFSLAWNREERRLTRGRLPSVPEPFAYGSAAVIGDTIFVAGGQNSTGLDSAMQNFWMLDMSKIGTVEFEWQKLPPWPGPARAFNLVVAQHNGFHTSIYLISGRRMLNGRLDFLKDAYEFDPVRADTPGEEGWRRISDAPVCVMAGTAAPVGQSHIFLFSGADGSLAHRVEELKDQHPGFPKRALAFHTITETWIEAGPTPSAQVTTRAVPWDGKIVIPGGEIRPRVRTPEVWAATPLPRSGGFGSFNYLVLFAYLLAMVGVGVYFMKASRDTNDFFRGGQKMVWWAAGCSIFATMLSSLTYTGIPSKAYAQDMVYLVGNMMIPVVAILAVYIALPFYRQIDATSAYEYLEKRFSRSVRLFGSASFSLFHLFRMGVILSLTGLALAAATPLTPAQSVLLMGLLSILYSTMGGIQAVIWTDTLQTGVLMGGAIIAGIFLLQGIDGGFWGFLEMANSAEKFRLANFHWDVTSAQISLWIIILGGIGQNLSSYTADQAVVQRYMTTASSELAARSIWTNALLAIPASILFFSIGTALFAFYASNPGRLDPTITTDQIFPLFIVNEMPVGIAGLIIAGIFAAAQSTVSTSMNSTATTLVTDFLRPLSLFTDEKTYLHAARFFTFLMGILGTGLGLIFVDPDIQSLFDTFIQVIGLFMGVLGGLFLLGVATRRTHDRGALAGALIGTIAMFLLWKYTLVNGYLYSFAGITICCVAGYIISLVSPGQKKNLDGLTFFTMEKATKLWGRR